MPDLEGLIRSERLALIELLESLTPAEWSGASLCGAWTVQDVAAHLAWAPVQRPREVAVALVKGGMRLNRVNAESALRWSRRGPAAIIEQLRVNAQSNAKPVGVPPIAALADAIVHALDIRRPLHKPRAIPSEAFGATANFFVDARWPLTLPVGGSARGRVKGVHVIADGQGWSYGHGPDVHASPEAVLLLLSGRPVSHGEFTGPGASRLQGHP